MTEEKAVSTRVYVTFGSDDGVTWRLLGTQEAASADQARNKARDEAGGYEHYAVTTERSWDAQTPHEKTTITWTPIGAQQATIEGAIQEAREALAPPPPPPESPRRPATHP